MIPTTSKQILVINSGSSSIKFCLFELPELAPITSGEIECIGAAKSAVTFKLYKNQQETNKYHSVAAINDHASGLNTIIQFFQNNLPQALESLYAVGHRVVHGGEIFREPALINEEVINGIQQNIPFAPLHNPANLLGIEQMHEMFPTLPQVAVFDTAFFQTLPPYAYRYAIPNRLYDELKIRRYGFHGTSHQYVAKQAATYLEQPIERLKLISLHLGNGASVAAIRAGKCIDTSMGMTPLEGLIMGTRCGDIDPSIPSYLAKNSGMDIEAIDALLNHESGLKGLCGSADMREVHRLANNGDEQAQLALEMFHYRVCKYIGAYYAVLGGLDALIFTGGIGENDANTRNAICHRLTALNITVDPEKNQQALHSTSEIHLTGNEVKVLVIPTNEELEIANQTAAVLNKR